MPLLLDIANDDRAPAHVRAWLAGYCDKLDMTTRMRAEIAVVEAINNAVAYRCTEQPGRIHVRLYRGRTLWVIQVRDANQSAELALVDATPEPEQIGGRGWFIIRQSTTAARYRRSGERNVITLALAAIQAAPDRNSADS